MDHRGVAGLVGAVWYFVLRFGQATDSAAARAQIAVEGAKEHAERAAAAERVVHADLARSWAPTTASDVEVMPEGKTFYPRMLADIKGATSSIHIMQYGFNPGVIGDQFTPVLEQKARDGVKVRIILDALGSHAWFGTKTMLSSLAAAGVEVMLHDAARRTAAVRSASGDGRSPRTSSAESSIASSSSSMARPLRRRRRDRGPLRRRPLPRRVHPLHRSGDPAAAGHLRRQLPLPRRDAADRRGALDAPSAGPGPGAHRVTVLMNWPRAGARTEAAFRLVREAASRLDMTNPYIGDPRMIATSSTPAGAVRWCGLLVSDDAHGGIAAAAFKHHYDALLDAGVQVWEYPALVHAKVIVSDDRALVGTLNLDAWAMYRNPELGLLFEDASVADQFRTVMIDPDVVVSKAGRRRPAVPASEEPDPRPRQLPVLRARRHAGDPGLQLPVDGRRFDERTRRIGPLRRVDEGRPSLPSAEPAVRADEPRTRRPRRFPRPCG